jgi:methionine biosynthesis protein MetW
VSTLRERIETEMIRYFPEFRYVRRPDFPRGSFDYERYWQRRGHTVGLPSRAEIFAGWVAPGARVLEVGCGDGALAQHLGAVRGCRVLAVDVSEQAVSFARERGVDACRRDVVKEPFERDTFEYVVLSEVIEHLPLPEELLAALRPVAPCFLVSLPNTAYIFYRVCLGLLGRFPTQWVVHPSEHLRFWSVTDFRAWARAQGFSVTREAASNGIPILKRWHHNLFGHQMCYELHRVEGRRP